MINHYTKESIGYDDLEWNLPERVTHGKNIVIIGGNKQNFFPSANLYEELKNEANVQLVLPSTINSLIKPSPEESILFGISNESGSFSMQAKPILQSSISNGWPILINDDISNNTETLQLLNQLTDIDAAFIVNGDVLKNLVSKENMILVGDTDQIQSHLKFNDSKVNIKHVDDIQTLAEILMTYCNTVGLSILLIKETNYMIIDRNEYGITSKTSEFEMSKLLKHINKLSCNSNIGNAHIAYSLLK